MNKAEKQAAADSLKNEAKVLRQTRENYREARANIEDKIKALAEREQTQSVIWQRQYQEALKAQLDTAIDALSSKNYANVSQYLNGEYENGFLGTMYSMQKQGIPLAMPIDQRRVVKMVETGADGIKLSKRLYGNATKLKNAVRREVSIGLASGEGYEDIAGRLSRTMGVDYNKTIRIARTEGGRVQNSSRFDAMEGAKKNGADIVKQWDSTLDNRTRTAHRELDGQTREIEDMFESEGQKAMHPHGFGVPWMDINCRCVVVQRARWAIEDAEYGDDYTKFSRFEDFDRDEWINGTLAQTAAKNGGAIVDLSDARSFTEFKARYKTATASIAAQNAAKEIGVEVMGSAQSAVASYINPDAKVYAKVNEEQMEVMRQIIENAPDNVREIWIKREDSMIVKSSKLKNEGAYFEPKGKGGVYLNIQSDYLNECTGRFSTWFHEFGHNIDWSSNRRRDAYISTTYKNNLFGKTLREEVDGILDRVRKEIAEEYGLYPSDIGKIDIHSSIRAEILDMTDMQMFSLSDIIEGATNGELTIKYGHGKDYWKANKYEDRLSTEAFAEMYSATMLNGETLVTLKEYLPRSYDVFTEILEEIAKR